MNIGILFQNAYKMVPCPHDQLRLQGFFWLGKYWVELRQVFGAVSAVYNYDRLHFCVSLIAQILSKIDQDDLHRTLDDQVVVSVDPERHKLFMIEYQKVCLTLNIPLAPFDGRKAFLDRSQGIVLGVWFDIPNLSWSLDPAKIDNYIITMNKALLNYKVSIKALQSINGIMNHIIIHCPLLRFYRTAILEDIRLAERLDHAIFISPASKHTLVFWQKMLQSLKMSFPIPDRNFTSRSPLQFVTDAAGLRAGALPTFPIGVGAVGTDDPNQPEIWYAGQTIWPESFISKAYDEKGAFIGHKTTTLELMGWFVPLYHHRHILKHRAVVIHVDNSSSMHAFYNGKAKNDAWASFLLSSIMFVLITLNCHLSVYHLDRVSNDGATLADALSRKDRKGLQALESLPVPLVTGWPPALLQWMEKPYFDPIFQWALLDDFLHTGINFTCVSLSSGGALSRFIAFFCVLALDVLAFGGNFIL